MSDNDNSASEPGAISPDSGTVGNMSDGAGVTVRGITKAFGANLVLDGIDLHLEPGKVTAMLGANGAGKSTLIKVLSGVHSDYGGVVEIDGEGVDLDHPTTARRHGIQVVHQKISDAVVPGLSVAENLLFEQIVSNGVGWARSLRALLPDARKMAATLDLDWSDDVLRSDVHDLSIADQQMLLLCRALVVTPRVLILDEPTSALSSAEADRLLDVTRALRDRGVAVLYVSHRLAEIDEIADRLVVLRDGKIRSDQQRPFDWNDALREMLATDAVEPGSREMELRGTHDRLTLRHVQLLPTSTPFDLDIRAGEVTGVFGLLGSGGNELAHGIFGSQPFLSGTMELEGEPYAPASPADAIARDVFMVPEDRATNTLIKNWSVAATTTFPFLKQVSRLSVLKGQAEAAAGREVIDEFSVVAQSEDDPVSSLSGGNQQKVVVGRWLRHAPSVMVLNEPFQGVDVGARHDLVAKARNVAAGGSSVVVMSTDLEEIIEIADRVIVLVDGNLRYVSYLADSSKEEILNQLSEVGT